jgi:hypothetical protein
MTQNPQTPSGTSFDDPDSTTMTERTAYDDPTSVTSAPPTGVHGTPAPTSTTASTPIDVDPLGTYGSSSGSVRDEAASVTSDAAQSGRQVADTAISEAKDVVGEARTQLSTLMQEFRSEATDQASGQSDRAVKGLRSLSDELKQMASSSQQNGLATSLVGQAADRVQSVAGWLEQRQPGEVLDEVRDFARRRPGTFLAAAAVVGLIGGRLTRGLTADSGTTSTSLATTSATDGSAYAGRHATSVGDDSTWVDAGSDPAASTYSDPGYEGAPGVEGVQLSQGQR